MWEESAERGKCRRKKKDGLSLRSADISQRASEEERGFVLILIRSHCTFKTRKKSKAAVKTVFEKQIHPVFTCIPIFAKKESLRSSSRNWKPEA